MPKTEQPLIPEDIGERLVGPFSNEAKGLKVMMELPSVKDILLRNGSLDAIALQLELIKSMTARDEYRGLEIDLAHLGHEINKVNTSNGWEICTPEDWPADGDIHKVRKLITALGLLITEVCEAIEAIRKRDKANFEEEMADTLIRLLDINTGLGINLVPVLLKKLEKNRHRGLHHGGKAV